MLLAVVFYGVSVPLGYVSLRYRDFLVDSVPLGQQIGDLLDTYELEQGAQKQAAKLLASKGQPAPVIPGPPGAKKETELTRYAESKAKAEGWQIKKGDKPDPEKAREAIQEKAQAAQSKVAEIAAAAKAKAGAAVQEVKEVVQKVETKVEEVAAPVVQKVKSEEPASTLPIFAQRPRELDATPLPPKKGSPKELYQGPPLPIGFEPAPGYEVARAPAPAKGDIKPVTPPPAPLPLVAPAVKDVASSEPILGQLASTIDSLAKFVANTSDVESSSATSVLSAAQGDITKLAQRLDAIKKSETEKLETSLKKQAGEYSGLLLKAEKELVERLDTQEEDWKKAFDDERKNLVGAYKAKLDKELETQQALINERLKEEVVAQGIELQRRWVREIKTRVEQERGGRLAKLEELEGGIRKLEKVARENEEVRLRRGAGSVRLLGRLTGCFLPFSQTINEAVQARKVFTAVKAIEHKVSAGLPFDAELRALETLTKSPLVLAAISSLPPTVASSGITSFPSLASRFTTSVAPAVTKVALLPEHGGLFAYLSSVVMSNFLFEKEGWSEGDDVVSTVARARFWLNNKDLEQATREVNTLSGAFEDYYFVDCWF